jgi:hypothetical protein
MKKHHVNIYIYNRVFRLGDRIGYLSHYIATSVASVQNVQGDPISQETSSISPQRGVMYMMWVP